jgi:hypothetical protein
MAQNDLINFGGKDERTLVTFLLIGKGNGIQCSA